jgi:hypothetical protein
MIVIVNGFFGILTGGAMIALATNTWEADTVGILLVLLGLGLAGLGWLGRKKIPIGGRYLALGMKEVNLRGASLFQDNMGETTVEPTNSDVLTELKVGDKVSVKDGKLTKEVSTGP